MGNMKDIIFNDCQCREILNNSTQSILMAESESRKIRYANESFCDLFQYSKTEILKMSIDDIHPQKDIDLIISEFNSILRGRKTSFKSIPCQKKDKTIIYADINTSTMFIDGISYILGFFHDISENIKKNLELRDSESNWRAIFNSIPHPAIIIDRDHNILNANEVLLKKINKTDKEIIGRKCFEVFHGNISSFIKNCPMEHGLATNDIETREMFIEALGGVSLVSCKGLREPDGSIGRIIHIATDITKQKELEKSLHIEMRQQKEATDSFRLLFNAIPDILGLKDINYNIIEYNKAGYEFLNVKPDEACGEKCYELIGRKSICDHCASLKLLKTKKQASITKYFQELDKWFDIRAYPIFDEKGEMIRVLEHIRDITDIKKAEEKRLEAENKLKQNQRLDSLRILAAGIAHDFNNLLAGIYGFLDLMRLEANTDNIKDYLDTCIKTINRAKNLTDQLLVFAKGMHLIKKSGDINHTVKETVSFALSGSNILSIIESDENLWNTEYDENQMAQVIENIAINAKQAMEDGGKLIIKICNRIVKHSNTGNLKDGKYIEIRFKDQGKGIPKEIQDKIFDPFFTTKSTGNGLGLSTSYSIIRSHNGHIDITSEPDNGTEFIIFLPAVDKIKKEEKPFEFQDKSRRRKGRILVMDDEKVIRESIHEILKYQGYQVALAENGSEALDKFSSSNDNHEIFDALFLDLTIPGGLGAKDIIGEIRKISSDIPVFLLTGYAEDPAAIEPKRYGFTDYINKPFLISDLTNILDKYTD